jgi:hypothetical protein
MFRIGEFGRCHCCDRERQFDSLPIIEAEPVAVTIPEFILLMHPRDGWTGTATELLAVLSDRVSDGVRRSKIWPMSAHALGNRIDRIAPLLRGRGFTIGRRHSGVQTITVMPPHAIGCPIHLGASALQLPSEVTTPRAVPTLDPKLLSRFR